jgi:hypothetical protein
VGLPWKLQAVLAAGAGVDEPNAEGWTGLQLAARIGDVEAARLLLAHRANIGAKLPDGKTPLHVAAEHGKLELVKLLVEAGADASAMAKGKTPRALAYGTHEQVARFLEPHTKVAAPAPAPVAPFAGGSAVQHVKFGVGTVVAREGDKLRVKFDDAERVLVARVLTPHQK